MTNANVERYHSASLIFLEQATVELEAGDLRQASEKGWGAAAQIVKAVAEQKGWEHRQHADLHVAASQIGRQLGEPDVMANFNQASHLHWNFYEGLMSEYAVQIGLDLTGRFVKAAEQLLHSARNGDNS